MSYLLTEEQQMLQDQVRALFAKMAHPDHLRHIITEDKPFDQELWRKLADLGMLGVAVPEEYGGVGLGAKELAIILEEAGRAVAPVPLFSSIAVVVEAIKLAGSADQKKHWLPLLASGEKIGTFGWTEGSSAPRLDNIKTIYKEGKVTGTKTPVADSPLADICLVVAMHGDQPTLLLVELDQPGVIQARLKGIDQLRHYAQIQFDATSAEILEGASGVTICNQILDLAAIYESFEQVGATEAAMLMARDYTLQRYIFGRQLGSFQAVKHTLANIYRTWDLAKCSALAAAEALEQGSQEISAVAACARVAANEVYDTIAREHLQLHGGIGFTWEGNCHFHYRRARMLALNLGSTEFWSDRLVTSLEQSQHAMANPKKHTQNRVSTSEAPEDTAYREEARAWITENIKQVKTPDDSLKGKHGREWSRLKAAAGYAAIAQPVERGGAGGTKQQARIFEEEQTQVGIESYFGMGYRQAVAAIDGHGTDEQKTYWHKLTNEGHAIWCQLFSEPGAGSDLAAVRTKAEKDGDNWIISGQKVWTSSGHHANYGILLARTDPEVPKHTGLSLFIIDMHQPGITTRPIQQMNGDAEFTETFFENATVPDSWRLGEPGQGWAVAMTVLAHERNTAGGAAGESTGRRSHTSSASLIELARSIERSPGKSALDSAVVRNKIAKFHMEAQAVKVFSRRLKAQFQAGGAPPRNIPVMKLTTTHRLQQIEAFLMDLEECAGIVQLVDSENDKFYGYLTSASNRIAGGADEVLRNQLAERALEMPGEVRMDKDIPFKNLPY